MAPLSCSLASNFRFYFLDPGQCLVPTCWGHLGRDPTVAAVPRWAFVMGLGLQHGAGWTAGSSVAAGPAVSQEALQAGTS